MKKILLAAAAALTTLAACQKNEIAKPSSEGSVIYATIEDNDATKTHMDTNNNILWSEGDQIVAFMKTSLGLQYQVTSSRKHFCGSLENHQLQTVAAACGYDLTDHHHALADAEACAWIAREIL